MAGLFAVTPAQNEFLNALIFLTTSAVQMVPGGAVTWLIRDAVRLLVIVEHYGAGLTAGSVKN